LKSGGLVASMASLVGALHVTAVVWGLLVLFAS